MFGRGHFEPEGIVLIRSLPQKRCNQWDKRLVWTNHALDRIEDRYPGVHASSIRYRSLRAATTDELRQLEFEAYDDRKVMVLDRLGIALIVNPSGKRSWRVVTVLPYLLKRPGVYRAVAIR